MKWLITRLFRIIPLFNLRDFFRFPNGNAGKHNHWAWEAAVFYIEKKKWSVYWGRFPMGKHWENVLRKCPLYRRFPEGKRNHCAWEAAVFYIEKKKWKIYWGRFPTGINIEKLYWENVPVPVFHTYLDHIKDQRTGLINTTFIWWGPYWWGPGAMPPGPP